MRTWAAYSLVIVSAIISSGAAGKPRASLGVFPHFSFAPHEVIFTIRIEGPEVEKFYCPKIEWIFGDGSASSTLSDCAPWESHESSDYGRVYTKQHKYWNPKEYMAIVILTAGKSQTKLMTNVVLAGDSADPDFASTIRIAEGR